MKGKERKGEILRRMRMRVDGMGGMREGSKSCGSGESWQGKRRRRQGVRETEVNEDETDEAGKESERERDGEACKRSSSGGE